MTKHPRIIAAIALVTLATIALTGCLVEKKEEKKKTEKKRGSDNLRIYKQGDWIRYNVIATTLSGTSAGNAQAGTLEVHWGNYSPLTSPDGNAGNDGNPYDVIEKRYLFCLGDASCNPSETVVIQYVHQDNASSNPASAGTERLVAMGGLPDGQYYWLNSEGGSNGFAPPSRPVPGGQETVITLKSPLFINDTYTVKYNLMDNCYTGTAGCLDDVGESTTSIKIVGDSTSINTNIGNYANPFRVDYFNGKVFPDVDVGGQLPLTFDIFDLCSNGISTHYGHMYIIPEIGVIQMQNTCTDSSTADSTRYDITIDSISSSIRSGS